MNRTVSISRAAAGLALAGALLVSSGCGSGRSGEQAGGGGGPDGPDGKALYAANCANCHGGDLRGTPVGPSQLSEVYQPSHHGDAAYRAAIANGSRAHHWPFGDMPAVPGLSDEEVDAIIAFIRAEQEERGFEPYPPR